MTTSRNRLLGLIATASFCGILAGFVGLGRLVWDQLQGVASPEWLPEWSIKGLAAGVVVSTAVEGWRKHPLFALKTIGAATAIYLGCKAVLSTVLATYSISSLSVSRVALAGFGVWAWYVLQSILASVAAGEPLLAVRPGPFGINLTEEERRGRRTDAVHGRTARTWSCAGRSAGCVAAGGAQGPGAVRDGAVLAAGLSRCHNPES